MHLVVLWKENINFHLSIMDFKDRAEDNIFEENWLSRFKQKIHDVNPYNKTELLNHLHDLDKTKKAFKSSLKDLKNDTNDILKKYDDFYCSKDEKSILFFLDKGKINYRLRLEEIFCIDNERIEDREVAIQKSEEWINNGLVNFDLEIRDEKDNVLYTANENTGIDLDNQIINNFIKELEYDYQVLKDYNEKTIAFLEYMKKREIIPEILSRTDGKDSFIKAPSQDSVAAFSTILMEKNVLKLDTIGQYQKKLKLK